MCTVYGMLRERAVSYASGQRTVTGPAHIDHEPSGSCSLGSRRVSRSLRCRAAIGSLQHVAESGSLSNTPNQARRANEPYKQGSR